MTIDRGDIHWLQPDPDTDPGVGVSHPHVVIQDDVFNHSRVATVVVCALTTNMRRVNEPGNVLLDEGEAGLAKRSVAVVSQVSSVAKDRLGEYVGTLTGSRVDQILAGMRFQQASGYTR